MYVTVVYAVHTVRPDKKLNSESAQAFDLCSSLEAQNIRSYEPNALDENTRLTFTFKLLKETHTFTNKMRSLLTISPTTTAAHQTVSCHFTPFLQCHALDNSLIVTDRNLHVKFTMSSAVILKRFCSYST